MRTLTLLLAGVFLVGACRGIVSALAEGWTVSPGGITCTFHLRRNVTFHNGAPFTAADVLFKS